jgi:hypothetical protein
MTIDNGIRILAGIMILTALGLGTYVHPYWYLLGVFVGVNLIQSAFTGICPAATLLKKLGCKPTCEVKA